MHQVDRLTARLRVDGGGIARLQQSDGFDEHDPSTSILTRCATSTAPSATSASAPTATSSTSRSSASSSGTSTTRTSTRSSGSRCSTRSRCSSSAAASAACSPAPGSARPASTTSAWSRRAATSAAPGTGTATRARRATSSRTSTCRCSRRSATSPRRSTPGGRDPRTQPGDRSALRPVPQRLLPDRGHGDAVGRRRQPLARHDEPRRRDARPLHLHGERTAAPAEAARHPRHRVVRGAHVPHQPVGLRLHRRRLRREPDRSRRQARRHHRHRRHGRAVRAPPRCRGQGAVRLPAHAVVDRRARQPPDRPRVGEHPRRGVAGTADGELQQPRHRHPRVGGSRQRRLDRHHRQPADPAPHRSPAT